ncbi:MAG: CRTAC1 family protein [Polyangiales bacterium]
MRAHDRSLPRPPARPGARWWLVGAMACGGCDEGARPSDAARPRVNVVLRGRFEVTERFSDGRDAVTVVGDCNGDDRIDLVNGATLQVQGEPGRFAASPLPAATGRKVGTMTDLDGDGAVDLVLVGADVVWLPGDGACHFGEPRTLADPTPGEPAQVLVHDVDRDGLTDLTVARQERRDVALQLLVARGDGRFDDRAPPPTPRPNHLDRPFRTFGTFYDDVDGDGALDLFASLDDDLGWVAWGTAPGALTFAPDLAATTIFSAVSPMSLSPIDHDRDGVFDYFVSGTFGNHLLLHHEGQRVFRDVAPEAGVSVPGSRDDGWGSVALDVNLDGYTDLLVREEPDDHQGPGPVRLLINRHDGTFSRAPASVLDEVLKGTSLACADVEADGRVSCFARDTTTRGLVYLRNRLEPEGRWVGLRLQGTVSSPDASGARVTLDGVAPPAVAMVGGQSPSDGEHDRGVILALGGASTASVTVDWPSGIRQRVSGLAPGRYTRVVEPRVLTLSSRVARADGAARVEITVMPALAGAAAVALECVGACAWDGPAVTDAGGAVRRALRAPTVPGEARVEVRLEGVALRVRPRVRFE